jgi:hypothetical protein
MASFITASDEDALLYGSLVFDTLATPSMLA